jgi:hypothetical protein
MKKINIIGLMSGTSLDGVDLAYAQFWFDNKWHFEIIACKTYEYELIIKEQLEQAFVLTGLQLAQLNVDLGRKMGNLINDFCDSYTIDKKSIDAIAQASIMDLILVDEIGDKIAQSVVQFFENQENRLIIDRLKQYGIQLESAAEEALLSEKRSEEHTSELQSLSA